MNNKWESIYFDSFQDLKKKAYKVVTTWKNKGFNDQWKENYFNRFAPSSDIWLYEDVIELYADYLRGIIPKEEAEKKMKEFEIDFNKSNEMIDTIIDFHSAMYEAYEKSGKEFGKIIFECPSCGGKAFAVKIHTPEHPVHEVTIRAGCKDCGISMMN